MKTILALSLLLVGPAAAQDVQFSTAIHANQSQVSWSVASSAGTVNVSPSTFRLAGSIELLTDSSSAPFTSAALNGALVYTDPNRLSGEVPNVLPFLPPLASFDLDGLQFHLSAPSFAVDPFGNFTADVTLTTTAGTNTLGGLLGSGVEPVFGLESLPTPVTGTLTQSGANILLHLDLNVQVTLVDPGSGVTVDLSVVGPVNSFVNQAFDESLHVDLPRPMNDFISNLVRASNAGIGNTVYLAGSLAGLGNTPIAPLGITAGIRAPRQAGIASANGLGIADFHLILPPILVGRSVWLQAFEVGRVSNVAGTWVE